MRSGAPRARPTCTMSCVPRLSTPITSISTPSSGWGGRSRESTASSGRTARRRERAGDPVISIQAGRRPSAAPRRSRSASRTASRAGRPATAGARTGARSARASSTRSRAAAASACRSGARTSRAVGPPPGRSASSPSGAGSRRRPCRTAARSGSPRFTAAPRRLQPPMPVPLCSGSPPPLTRRESSDPRHSGGTSRTPAVHLAKLPGHPPRCLPRPSAHALPLPLRDDQALRPSSLSTARLGVAMTRIPGRSSAPCAVAGTPPAGKIPLASTP